jgi:hypothetical protein
MSHYGWIFVGFFFVALSIDGTRAAVADATQCYQVQNQDRKNFCLAQAKGQASYCYQIQDRDMKNVCLAQAQGQKSYCYQIEDRDLKNQCLSLF